MRPAEAVEEVQKWQPRSQRCGMRDRRDVVSFLHAGGRQHHPAGRTSCHHIGMITEDRQCMRRDRTRSHMQYRRREFTCNLVHVRQHQQQPLRTGETGRECSGLDCPVQGTRRPGFGLHLDNPRNLSPDIAPALRAPIISELPHRRSRRDRINRADITQPMRDRGGRLVALHTCPGGWILSRLFAGSRQDRGRGHLDSFEDGKIRR